MLKHMQINYQHRVNPHAPRAHKIQLRRLRIYRIYLLYISGAARAGKKVIISACLFDFFPVGILSGSVGAWWYGSSQLAAVLLY